MATICSVALPRSITQRLGPARAARLQSPGYLLLPLRLFLGITFSYAGLQKLANPAYLDRANPASVYAQMHALEGRSPIGPLVALATHAPTLVGLLIALGELAVGVGTLVGLLTRVAAVGGALLALSFFLTVSWNTSPYYYGSDIVFFFAWTVLIAFGSADVLSMDGWIRGRARRQVGLSPEPATVSVAATRLRELCGRGTKCGLNTTSGRCGQQRRCPAFAPVDRLSPHQAAELDRRMMLATSAGVAGVGLATAFLAGTTAAVGRKNNSAAQPAPAGPAAGPTTGQASPPSQPSIAPKKSHHAQPGTGTAIAATTSLPVGKAKPFVDPRNQQPAWLVHTASSQFVAFSAICTHAGCTVSFDANSEQFICPCHGGTYDAKTGHVLSGPPPAPLAQIAVHVSNGKVFTA